MIGVGKTTVEVLDRGEETPRPLSLSSPHAAVEVHSRDGDGGKNAGETSPSATPKALQVIILYGVDHTVQNSCLTILALEPFTRAVVVRPVNPSTQEYISRHPRVAG